MIANLMMYERPQLADAHGRFWQLIRHQLASVGIDSPEVLFQNAEEFNKCILAPSEARIVGILHKEVKLDIVTQ